MNIVEHLQHWLNHETALINDPNPLLVLAILLITGYVATKVASKLHIPTVTAQIVGGIVLGKYVLNLFQDDAFTAFAPITNFALGFIGLTIGSHMDFQKLRSAGKRISLITLTDVIITPIIIFFTLYYFAHLAFEVCLLISAISITTAPGSTLHIIREVRAKGIFTKTVLAVVALNNVFTILIFYAVFNYLFYKSSMQDINIINTVGKSLLMLIESAVVGISVGSILIYFTERRKTRISFLAMVILAVVLTVGTAQLIHLSGLLSCLILGIIITNYSKYNTIFFGAFKDIEIEVFTLFFVLAGTHFDLLAMKSAGFAGLLLIISRLIGKTFAPTLGAYLAKSTMTIKKWIGISLYPIAGVAIGLILLIENSKFLHEYSSQITAIVLTAVVVNELLGPIFTKKAIIKAGEEHKNRLRLMDFLQEEYIVINMEADDKWEALDKLAVFLHRSHKIREITLANLKKSIVKREMDISTGIGENLAIPHAIIDGGPKIQGVIGVSKKGIPFESIDGKPVNIIILIATPKENYDLHLHVLANIAKIFGHHPEIKEQIIRAKSPEEVFEILQAEEIEALNPFFEE
ncbi:MAG: PTS transporter subunit EIIA [Candidatus Cloacimonetes bacterium]|nr:PTS transporter subunit EIIA [Candidatus Cloacimonadota bacterium]MBT5419934.1 PTS transporter subunit EIIA [Candidatus Cloacimonadota bacterium]